MKKTNNLFFALLMICTLFLSGCSFLFSNNNSSTSESTQAINDFDFVTDNKLEYVEDEQYYCLTLYAGETYQIKTTIDDLLGDNYYLKYTTSKDTEGKFTLTENGYVVTSSTLEDNTVCSIYAELYKNGSTKRIIRKYCIFSLMTGEYANITLTNDNLEYDGNTSTYSMTMDSGTSYKISYEVSYNVAYVLSFSLKDPSYSSFMDVDDIGNISTNKTNEDKVGEITIKLTGANGVLDEVYLKVTLKKSEDFKNELKVYNKSNASEVNNGDTLSLYNNNELSFDVKYNGEDKTNVMTVSDSTILEVDNPSNTIKALKVGTSSVTFTFEEETLSIIINVVSNKLVSIEAKNGGNDFVIINNTLHYLNKMFAIYESGDTKEIEDNSTILTSITDKNNEYKTVTFTYEEDEIAITVTYDVKYYVVNEYEGVKTSYNNNDLFNNYRYGEGNVLPSTGAVKILTIPVWLSDSDQFFNESQKGQIIEDIEYTMNGNRPDTELASTKQYYEAQSYGAIEMDITVSDFYYSSKSYKDFTDNGENSKAENDNILVNDAISWYFDNHAEKRFEDYDLNNDGYLDGLVLLYGANYYGVSSDGNSSYAFESTNYGNDDYSYNTFSFCPIGGLYGLAKQNPTTQLTSSDLSATYSRNFRSSARIIIHEMGHMFGNKDLYEANSSSEKYLPAGGFVMQDNNCGGHDPYHTNIIGWSKPEIYASSDYELGDKITISLKDFQSSGQNIILTNKWNVANSLFDEYLIIELFAPTGLNKFDSQASYMNAIKSGIRLWHVNSLLTNLTDSSNYTSEIVEGQLYELMSSNNDPSNKYDTLHLIRNNPNEEYNTTSGIGDDDVLFNAGDTFDMGTFKSQFINDNKLDNGEKLGWSFKVDTIYNEVDGSYGAVITLERTDNVKTDFSKSASVNRSDLNEPVGEEDYSKQIFGDDGVLSFIYKYVTPPSSYNQNYPISSNGMCLFASSDGNGGYIDLTINPIVGKEVYINSISITYSRLTNASLTAIVDGTTIESKSFESTKDEFDRAIYKVEYEVNSSSIRIQNQYNGTIDHWSVIALYDITINYTIK